MAGQVVAEVAGKKIDQGAVESRLKLSGAWFGAVAQLQSEALVAQAAQKEGLSVSDAELQKEFDDFRLSRGLEKADDTLAWLKSAGLTVDDVEGFLEAGLLANKVAKKVISDAAVDAYYKQNPQEFEFAQISHLVVSDGGAAQELALSAREEGESFADLARKHSIDKGTSAGGGFLGRITRLAVNGIPADVADQIFSGRAGDVVGPFPTGKAHCVVHVLEVGRRPLDEGTRAAVRSQLFGQWLAERAK
jgi:parvulin-like peptidyl-prolyl isomerase